MTTSSCKISSSSLAGLISLAVLLLGQNAALAGNLLHVPGSSAVSVAVPDFFNRKNLPVSQTDIPRDGKIMDRSSLFDQLFLKSEEDNSHYDIPYPFSKVISRLEESLGISINGDANSVISILIPLGRCINRYAASPDFFEHPRVLIGVDAEHYGNGGRHLAFLKDKIFIGYQETANAMEVISYSQEAGRFEFQVVKDYSINKVPEVEYVERTQCTGCHQNNGPIFPQPPWSETNNNREVFQKLTEVIVDSNLETPVFQGSDASDLDGASNRANLFQLYQAFWQGVCQTQSKYDLVRCRAAIFEMVLLHRLQENNRSLAISKRINDFLYPASINGIAKRWPRGISILSSDIINENPIQNGALLHLASAKKLLYPRSLMINWQPKNLIRVIGGLGQFISLSDLRYLDSLLYRLAAEQSSSKINLTGNCQLQSIRYGSDADYYVGQTGDISVNCDLKDGIFSRTYHFLGEFYIESGDLKSFPVSGPLVIDTAGSFLGLTHQGGSIESSGGDWVMKLDLFDSKQQFHARLPGGGILQNIEIRWPKGNAANQLFDQNALVDGFATLSAVPGYEVLDTAISAMIARADNGTSDLFSQKPFRGKKMMDGLFRELE